MENEGKKLLLHVCCGPCAVYVVEKLKKEYTTTCFFYNPNIQPKQEYDFRKNELVRVSDIKGWKVEFPEYDIRGWFEEVRGLEKEPEKGKRCSVCFYLRLKKTFDFAKFHGFSHVASTLSISPYKVTSQINLEGEKLSKEYHITFIPENFKSRNGYQIAKTMAYDLGIKHQNYCGCVYSKVEKKVKERTRK
jgi:predicted adenine nucleotide alpha hydrolase (AANH) superfamily ATPase